jgi:hypothetical protein
MAKFSGLKELKKNRGGQPVETSVDTPAAHTGETTERSKDTAILQEPTPAARTARVGKRNNPEYVQRTAYIRKTTDRAVKRKLFDQGEGKEFSELVDELLSQWVTQQEQ